MFVIFSTSFGFIPNKETHFGNVCNIQYINWKIKKGLTRFFTLKWTSFYLLKIICNEPEGEVNLTNFKRHLDVENLQLQHNLRLISEMDSEESVAFNERGRREVGHALVSCSV